jgi:hypothetical protein
MAMNRARLARLLLLASIVYVAGFYFAGSAIKPGYSQVSNFVSEYNATGTAWATTLTYAGFVATTAILSAFLVAVAPLLDVSGASRVGAWLLWSLPASYLLAAIAPCDAGCPAVGSASQIAHNVLALIAYCAMGLSIFLLARAPGFDGFKLRRACMLLIGTAFPIVFFLMVQPQLAPWGGLLQRLLDVAMAASLVVVVSTLATTQRDALQPATR